MIRYKLKCKKCNNAFDSWFSSSREYDKLKKIKKLNCHNCGSIKIEKTLMSPNVANSKNKSVFIEQDKKLIKIKNKIKEYQKFVKKNFDYVGDNFSHKARTLYYSDNKKLKGIYGKASSEEISELNNEGIETEVIPWFQDNEN